MLLSLFDGHENLIAYPSDSMFFYKVFPHCIKLNKRQNMKLVIDNCINHTLNYGMKDTQNNNLFDIDKITSDFKKKMSNKTNTPRSLLLSLIKSYSRSIKKKSWKMWVEKTTSSEFYVAEIIKWFPNAKFIHIIRDPRDNFASLKSGWEKRYKTQEDNLKDLLQSLLDRGGMGMKLALNNQKMLGKKI